MLIPCSGKPQTIGRELSATSYPETIQYVGCQYKALEKVSMREGAKQWENPGKLLESLLQKGTSSSRWRRTSKSMTQRPPLPWSNFKNMGKLNYELIKMYHYWGSS
jgi:hypothetical protein